MNDFDEKFFFDESGFDELVLYPTYADPPDKNGSSSVADVWGGL